MLKAIHYLPCSPAIAACQHLMKTFALWLCDPATTPAHLSQAMLQPPVLPSAIEADWLWAFLQRKEAERPLLERAATIAALPNQQKFQLATWIQTVTALASQFQPAAPIWPAGFPLANAAEWKAFKVLMEAFYEKSFKSGLPYLANGTPVTSGGVTYSEFVTAFREKHRLVSDPDAHEVCIFCGGLLGDRPHVDHWLVKSAFPILSMCAHNLTLICPTCNEAPNKGEKPVHEDGCFANWFHPYLNSGAGKLKLNYDSKAFAVSCSSVVAADHAKASHFDALLNLGKRWTREFKAKHASHRDALRRAEALRLKNGNPRHTFAEVEGYVQNWAGYLSPSEPHHEVHFLLGQAMSEPARIHAWLTELSGVH
jgi:hypothetical protein